MHCPQCGDEYETGHTVCVSCRVPLSAPGAAAPLRTRHLGRFEDVVGQRVLELLRAKGIDYDFDRHPDQDLTVRVDADWRDDVASELYRGWSELLGGLEREVAFAVVAQGGTHPGWRDAPTDAWTDREGRIQVEIGPDGDPDRGRAIGPGIALIGLSLVLLGLVDAISAGLGVTFGLILLVLGALLPR